MKVLLIAYDNGSYIHEFPMGIAYIASALRQAGHDVVLYNQDKFHYPESHLVDYLTKNRFDVVGLGVIGGYYQYQKLLKISEAVNRVPNRPLYILGGHGPAPDPEYFLKKTEADVIILGEGELTVVDLLDALEHQRSLSTVKGIAYLDGGHLVQTSPRELIKDLDSIPLPAWELFPMDYYALIREPHIENHERAFSVLSGRGCPFRCNFCYRIEKGFRPRTPESIIEEIQMLKQDYGISYIEFLDELLMSSVQRTVALCEAFIKANLSIKWNCNGRLNYAKPEVLKVMKKAGCVFINYGIESLDDNMLKVMHKNLTVAQITRGIEATLAEGISPGFNIIFGNIGETPEILQKGVDFLLKYDDHSQLRTIRPVTPYPGCDLYYYAIEKGLLKDCADFYENKHINSDLLSVNFTGLSDDEFYRVLFEANKTLLENYYQHLSESMIGVAERLYFQKDASFRGFRQT
ncbi:MAG: radical SAM protein [Chloroflexi bacterium]|nr:radical SAM protein [Chloroflexota bacterium]